MTDLPSSLGIEAVECLSEGGRSLTVRVIGRWRRRRPELRGQPMLVVETETGRQRFLAMPEPPSLTGAAPGTWRMSFSVPLALGPALPGHTFLQLGGVMVPLPIGEVALGREVREAAEVAEVPALPSPEVLEARRVRAVELAAETARRRAADLAADVERLERELGEARARSDRLQESIAERELALRRAEQHAHAERALRIDLEQELTRRTRGAQHDLRVLHDRVADLERELIRMRRAVDEAGHLAVAAEAARAEAERRLAERAPAATPDPPPPAPAPPLTPAPAPTPSPPPAPAAASLRAAGIRRELELRRATPGPPAPVAHHPDERAGDRAALGQEAAMAGGRRARGDAVRITGLERELAAARQELATARQDLATERRRSARAYEAIELVRGELRRLHAPVPAPAASRMPDESVQAAPVQAPPVKAEPVQADPVQAERLSEALARLRERSPAVEPAAPDEGAVPAAPDEGTGPADQTAPARATRPWLHAAFRRLAGQDASAAGHLLLALLPAQRAADPRPVAYDLVLSDVLVAHVTVDSLGLHVEHDATARPRSEVDFQLVGDLASMARLLRAGRVRRRLRVPPWRLARLRGDRRRLAVLDRLIEAQLTARELHAAGVRLDPMLAFTLAGLMIEPGWTEGERFTIGHRAPAAAAPDAYLHIRDGRPALASAEPPHGPVCTVLAGPREETLGALAGATSAQVMGEERPLALLRQWLDRAQSG